MSEQNHTTPVEYFHPDDPAGWLKPDQPLMVDGLDWSWAFVWYKPIPRFPGYCAGWHGSIWSLYIRGHGIGKTWKRLSPTLTKDRISRGRFVRGQLRINLVKDKKHCYTIFHKPILEAFFGPCPPGMEACHCDDNFLNNRVSNLRWDTHKANVEDKIRNGKTLPGERNPNAKLKRSDIPEIFRLASEGLSQREIASIFGVGQATISRVLTKQCWPHVAV